VRSAGANRRRAGFRTPSAAAFRAKTARGRQRGERMERINKLTEGRNLLWESSRMILPEHKEKIRGRRDEARRGGRRERPVLDEQERERIQAAMAWSLERGRALRLELYGPYGNEIVEGAVEEVRPDRRQIRVGGRWIDAADIVGAAYDEDGG